MGARHRRRHRLGRRRRPSDVGVLLAIGFVAVAGLWWCSFDWVHAAAEARLAREPDHRRRSNLARDLFTFGHLPIVAGTVVFAAAIEEALLHPGDHLGSFGMTALAVGLVTIVIVTIAATETATRTQRTTNPG